MRIKKMSHWASLKKNLRFLTARQPLPKSSAGDAENGSSGSGMTNAGRDAAVPLAAIQLHHAARAPPACLIVQLSMPGCDPNAPPTNRSPIRMTSEQPSVSFRGRLNACSTSR